MDSDTAKQKIQFEAAWNTEHKLKSSKYICEGNVSLWKVLEGLGVALLLILGKKKIKADQTEWDGSGVVDWRKWVKRQGLLLITPMAFSNNWMNLWKGCSIHPLSFAHKLYKKHIVSKDLVTHKKSRQCLGHT